MSWTNPLVRRILDSLPHFAWQSSASTGAVEWHNKWWYDYTGLQPGSACGSGWEQMLHPEDRERVRAAWPACVATGRTYRVELRMRAADGSYRWFLTCGQPLYNDAGVPARWLGTVFDITAQKELQQELEDERALLVTALDQLPVSVLVAAAPSGQLRFVNKKTAEVFRHPPLACDTLDDYARWRGFHPDGRPYAGRDWPLARSILTGEVVVAEDTIFERGDGVPGIIRLWSSPVRNTEGAVVAAVVVGKDVTDERARAEEQARLLAAEKAAEATTNLMANVSHELRTPLHGILGLVDLALQERHLSEELREYLAQIRQSGKLLLVVINDVLDHSKIVAGKLELESLPFRLQPLVAHVMSLMAEIAKAKGVTLRQDMATDLPAAVEGDPQRLQQIWMNVLSNAIRFTLAGGVVSMTSRLERTTADNKAVLQFQVQDSGIGMSAETMSRLFKPFTQADSSTTRRFGGTGLGLAISKQLVTLMGGTISVQSALGAGSAFTFTVCLPVCDADSVTADSPTPSYPGSGSASGPSAPTWPAARPSPGGCFLARDASTAPPAVSAPHTSDTPRPMLSPTSAAERVGGYRPSPQSLILHAQARAGVLPTQLALPTELPTPAIKLGEPPVTAPHPLAAGATPGSLPTLSSSTPAQGHGLALHAPRLFPAASRSDAQGWASTASDLVRAGGTSTRSGEEAAPMWSSDASARDSTTVRQHHLVDGTSADGGRGGVSGLVAPLQPRSPARDMGQAPRLASDASEAMQELRAGPGSTASPALLVRALTCSPLAAGPPVAAATEGESVSHVRSIPTTRDSLAAACAAAATSLSTVAASTAAPLQRAARAAPDSVALSATGQFAPPPAYTASSTIYPADTTCSSSAHDLASGNAMISATGAASAQAMPAGALRIAKQPSPLLRDTRTPSTTPSQQTARILLAEDNAVNSMIAKRFLRNLGHRDVTHVENGQGAVEALVGGDFDLVLMDCQMPVMDGFEATRRIRAIPDPAKRVVPIVALTASALKADIDRCMAAGMDDHLSKPYDCKALASKLSRWLYP